MESIVTLLFVAGLGAAVAYWRTRPRPPDVDPRLAALQALTERFDAGLLQLIRERYSCTEENAKAVQLRLDDWAITSSGIPIAVAADGAAILDDNMLAVLDDCALEVGLRPAHDL